MNNIDNAIQYTIADLNDMIIVSVPPMRIRHTRELLETYFIEDFSEVTKSELDKSIIEAVKIEKMAHERGMELHAAARDYFTLQVLAPVNN